MLTEQTFLEHPRRERSSLRGETTQARFLAQRDTSSRKPDRKVKKPRGKAGDLTEGSREGHPRRDHGHASQVRLLISEIHYPREGVCQMFPHRGSTTAQQKENKLLCVWFRPSWALGGGNSSSRATSASHSAGGIPDSKDMPCGQNGGPGDLLWGLM